MDKNCTDALRDLSTTAHSWEMQFNWWISRLDDVSERVPGTNPARVRRLGPRRRSL